MPHNPLPEPALHLAARVESRFTGWRAGRARANGFTPLVIPYTAYGGDGWIRVLGRVLLNKGTHRLTGEPAGARGWRSFTSVPVQRARVEVEVGGVTNRVTADRSGLLDAVVPVDLEPGWHQVEYRVESSDPSYGLVFVVAPEARFGLLSDIDDTVMMTALPRPLLAAWHTFVVNEHARTTTPGMPVLYERLTDAHAGAPVLYLSTGAWNVAPTLTRFLSRNLYPAGALLLTDWGPTPDAWFRDGTKHKRDTLERLAHEFPQVRWLLVGDDGQHDPATYSWFCERHPDQVLAVCIRQLTPGEAVLAGSGNRAHVRPDGSDVRWFYAYDGAGLAEQLEDAGLLAGSAQQPEVES
ncbi:MAG: App1 family protein [Janthinobacterium lividum]